VTTKKKPSPGEERRRKRDTRVAALSISQIPKENQRATRALNQALLAGELHDAVILCLKDNTLMPLAALLRGANPGTFTSFPIYRQDAETADRICCNLRRLGQVADKPVSGNLPSHWSETESTGRPSVRDADYSSKWNSPMVISEHYGVFGD
jgi:hypothetical protein